MDIVEKTERFKAYLERKIALDGAVAIMMWDQSAGGAPAGGARARAKTVGYLSGEAFAVSVSSEMKDFLDALLPRKNELDAQTRAMLRICEKDYKSMEKIPKDEFAAYSQTLSLAEVIWEEAKAKSDFSIFAPTLDVILNFLKRFIEYRGYESHPYDVLLNDYEPGLGVKELDAFFGELKQGLTPFTNALFENGAKNSFAFVNEPVPACSQKKIARLLMNELGFDLNRGLLGTSEHPFTNGVGRTDVRITTHYYENAFLSSFYSVLHETGHALYEQNTAAELEGTILDSGVSMGVHESQSRFYENLIGRSKPFWEYITDKIKPLLPESFANRTADDFYAASNVPRKSLIRIEADELTYSLHILIRYEMEKFIFSNGNINVYALRDMWNDLYKSYLGITPPDDAKGILQDTHWACGLFGYFPSYAVGNAYASMIYSSLNGRADIENLVRNGDFAEINRLLADGVHKHGSLLLPDELIFNLCGEKLTPKYYIEYLKNKFK